MKSSNVPEEIIDYAQLVHPIVLIFGYSIGLLVETSLGWEQLRTKKLKRRTGCALPEHESKMGKNKEWWFQYSAIPNTMGNNYMNQCSHFCKSQKMMLASTWSIWFGALGPTRQIERTRECTCSIGKTRNISPHCCQSNSITLVLNVHESSQDPNRAWLKLP